MAYVARSNFISGNVAFQGKDIWLSFPAATDKNIDTITYSIQYTTQPIYCKLISTTYVCTDSVDTIYTSPWEVITSFESTSPVMVTKRTMPNYATDVVLRYTIKATDNTPGGGETLLNISSGDIYLIRNTSPVLQLTTTDWTSEDNITISGVVTDAGFTHPANYSSIGGTAEWASWRNDLKTILDATDAAPAVDMPSATFTYYYSYSIDGVTYSTAIRAKTTGTYDFDLTTDWIANKNFSFVITNPGDMSSANSYYIKLSLRPTTYASYNSYVQLLLNKMPVLNMKKGILKVNMPQSDTGKTGAMMISRGPQQGTTGDSIALYDHHVETGQSVPNDKPSIGFYKTDHTLLAKISAVGNDIVLTPGASGVVKVGSTTLLLIPSQTGNSGKYLTTNGTSMSWAAIDSTDYLPIAGGTMTGVLRLSVTADATATSTDHAFQIGPTTGANLIIDPNEIMARNNGVVSSLALNAEGGLVTVGSGGLTASGTLTIAMNSITTTLQSRNSSYFHIETNAPYGVYFGSAVRVAGEIYAGAAYNQQVWHTGNLTPSNYLLTTGKAADSNLLDGHDTTYFALASHTHSYLPLSGGTITGALTVNGAMDFNGAITIDADSFGTATPPTGTGRLYFKAS